MSRLVNRTDAYGRYRPIDQRAEGSALTVKSGATAAILANHFRGDSVDRICGLHSTDADDNGRWFAIDVDAHEGDDVDGDANMRFAVATANRLYAEGIQAVVEDSNGKGGYHVWVFMAEPVPASTLLTVGQWAIEGWSTAGVGAKAPEIFPKQRGVTGKGKGLGNWLRAPGRHHSRDHWSRIWEPDKGDWLEGADAIDALIRAPINNPALLDGLEPSRAPVPAKPEATKSRPAGSPVQASTPLNDPDRDVRLAAEAIGYLDPNSTYHEWLNVGFSLSGLGATGLAIWESWSRASSKHKDGECSEKWSTFTPGVGRNLGSLFSDAIGAGWTAPWARSVPAPKSRPAVVAAPAVATPPPVGPTTTATPPPPPPVPSVFTNFRPGPPQGANNQPTRNPLRIGEIADDLAAITGGWPRSVGGEYALFHHDGKTQAVTYLEKPSRLYAWAGRYAPVEWGQGIGMVPQEQTYEDLRMQTPHYAAVETSPHFPPLPGHYYAHQTVGRGDGRHLDQLLDFFSPATETDRQLILLFLITLVWGGPNGSRPIFLTTSVDDEGASTKGRGQGKSYLSAIAAELVGGLVEVSTQDDLGTVKTRLLSPAARHLRVCRLDNVKAAKLSWADLEGLITSPVISGRQLYTGEGSRPNTITWAITLNGASLSKDLAVRTVTIKLARPSYTKDWEIRLADFIKDHRWDVLADLAARLETQPGEVSPKIRFGTWRDQVLARVEDPEGVQQLILDRQAEMDSDDDETAIVRDYILGQLAARRLDPDSCAVFLSASTAAIWLSDAERKSYTTNRASTRLEHLAIPELKKSKTAGVRGWGWRGHLAGNKSQVRLPNPPDDTGSTSRSRQNDADIDF